MDNDRNFEGKVPEDLSSNLRVVNCVMPEQFTQSVIGYDFSKCEQNKVDFDEILSKYSISTGYQSTKFGHAVQEVKKMIEAKLSDTPLTEEEIEKQMSIPLDWKPRPCTIFLGCTSNIITAGTRETIRYLVEHRMVDCLVTTAGGIEEDFIKCMAPVVIGEFNLDGKDLFHRRINRTGNLLTSNENYCMFEGWLAKILDVMLKEEQEDGVKWTPSKFINRLGKEIDNKESIYYWAYKNNVPVFCPALTDGAIGDILFCHTFKHDGVSITLDITQDVRMIDYIALRSVKSGIILLGGGVSKHHVLNANSMRGGANFSVYINTAQEFDGCDSGAKPEEAISWGKINVEGSFVKVHGEASFILPLLVSQTFFKYQKQFDEMQ